MNENEKNISDLICFIAMTLAIIFMLFWISGALLCTWTIVLIKMFNINITIDTDTNELTITSE